MPAFIVVYFKVAAYVVFFQCRHAYLHIKHLPYFYVEVKNITFSHFLWHIQLFKSVIFLLLIWIQEIVHFLSIQM